MINTAESISNWHPDKICDLVADNIVKECLKQDSKSRCAVEVLGGHGLIFISGEVTTKAIIDYCQLTKDFYLKHCGKEIDVMSNIVTQSPDIALGVDKGGAGDQGIMYGYACDENEEFIPQEKYLADKLLEPFKTDAKSQVTIEDEEVTDIVLSVQGEEQDDLIKYVYNFCNKYALGKPNIYCNWTGKFEIGGFDADCGVTGRKIVCDQYGPRVPVGGGAFSGKDFTKVDRSGALMARHIALDLLKKYKIDEVLVKISYCIGKSEPLMVVATIDGEEYDISEAYDCKPQSIIKKLKLGWKTL
jgi:S-adenosylmethionine synthetase